MPYNYTWEAQSCSPKFLLNAGTTASGKRITKSVAIRGVNPNCLSPTEQRLYLQNIIGTIQANNPFMLSIYRIQVDGKYYLDED